MEPTRKAYIKEIIPSGIKLLDWMKVHRAGIVHNNAWEGVVILNDPPRNDFQQQPPIRVILTVQLLEKILINACMRGSDVHAALESMFSRICEGTLDGTILMVPMEKKILDVKPLGQTV